MYSVIRLYSSEERFVLEPLATNDGENDSHPLNTECLQIDRTTGPIQFTTKSRPDFDPKDSVLDIYGIIGIINLIKGPYLIVISGRKFVGKIDGADIWRMTKYKIIPFVSKIKLTPLQQQDEDRYVFLLDHLLSGQHFYFSYKHDITHRLQHIVTMSNEQRQQPLWKRADNRFFWNYNLLQEFIKLQMDAWILPIMMGYIEISECTMNSHVFSFILISRRNKKRAGTRYNVRGVDLEGNVANNMESEQIIQYHPGNVQPNFSDLSVKFTASLSRGENIFASYVQTRGSIPVFWQQKPNLKYKPKPTLTSGENESATACRRHLEEQIMLYGNQVLVNLIDQKGSELMLGEQYETQIRKLNNPSVRYVSFDFHKQCKGMRYDRLQLLLDQIQTDIDKQGYLLVDKRGNVLSTQLGAVRTNCMDNLDRTNVVQSLVAHAVLERQLWKLGILNANQKLVEIRDFERLFKSVWANNGDAISTQYSGTGALKADFTRTGKRTYQGLMMDGYNSALRYYLNNFQDGYRQDSYDLFLGNYAVDPDAPSPYAHTERSLMYFAVLFIGALMLAISLFAPSEINLAYKLAVVIFWVVAVFLTWRTLMYYGPDLVNKPALVPNN